MGNRYLSKHISLDEAKLSGLLPPDAQATRLRELEHENARLKRIVVDLSLDKEVLQEIVKRKI